MRLRVVVLEQLRPLVSLQVRPLLRRLPRPYQRVLVGGCGCASHRLLCAENVKERQSMLHVDVKAISRCTHTVSKLRNH